MTLPKVTECFLIQDGRVALGRKKRGLGAGKIVGIGGKLDAGESPLAGALREIREEVGVMVAPSDLQHRGQVAWYFPCKAAWQMEASVFVAERWAGTMRETDEIEPVWFTFDAVPWDLMWADARLWVPRVLHGGRADWVFVYNDDNATIKSTTPLR